ncbi:DUF5018 domain-containing protein [uncultured Tenacibaculum sp.]|uniref:DUF5018 domain-containing protein n=1 Tax=uncultured Tenacibaculum sp. TaxID=174713 RepID=UPI00261749FE|nr:DUF5018 domain-containing protein [uncultured Tenacibaculum sp.]
MTKKILSIVFAILTLISCSKDEANDPIILSSENSINSFKLTINGEVLSGDIDQLNKTIKFNVVGADLSSLKPTIDFSSKAKIIPSENEYQNFTNEVTYTVYAENGDTNIYKVLINNRPLNTESKILSFSVTIDNQTIEAEIDEDSKTINFDAGGLDISSLTPTISISSHANISPNSSDAQNFEIPVNYTVTAENGSTSQYKVIANMPEISNHKSFHLYYIRASMIISGNFLDPTKPGAEIFLDDGTNKYKLPIIKHESYSTQERITIFNIFTKIPENVLTSSNYKIIYKTNSLEIKSSQFIDVVAENAPKFISLNKTAYSKNDVLIVNGENIPDTIVIPSNGSQFIIRNSHNFDYTVNSDKTEASLTLDYHYLFPSYFGNPPSEKTISFWGPEQRIGESFTTIFN